MSNYILAHDIGTSGNKASLFTTDGEYVDSDLYPYDAHYFNDVWVEENAEDWWQAVCKTSKTLIDRTGIEPKNIKVVSFSGQMIGCLCVDKYGNPLRPSIIWADQRAQKQADELERKISQRDFYAISGHPNKASYAGQKLMWVRDNQPDVYKKTFKTLNSKDYIVFKLTGKFHTDPSDGHSYSCFDMETLDWSDKLIDLMGLDREKFPEIVPSTAVVGEVTKQASEATGLAVGTPVVMGAGDGPAGNVGAGSVKKGQAYIALGTSSWVAVTSDKPVFDYERMSVVNWAHAVPGHFSANGTMQYGGGSYNWIKENICRLEVEQAKIQNTSPYVLMNELAGQSMPGSNGLIFLPYLVGERSPWWDSDAKGAWIGLKAETTRGDIIRSVMEGVTFNLGIIMNALRKGIEIDEVSVIGGGAKGRVWQQILADVLDVRVAVPSVTQDANSMGAAVIGGVGTGLFKDFNAINKFYKIDGVIDPIKENVEKYRPYRPMFEECYLSLKNVFKKFPQN